MFLKSGMVWNGSKTVKNGSEWLENIEEWEVVSGLCAQKRALRA